MKHLLELFNSNLYECKHFSFIFLPKSHSKEESWFDSPVLEKKKKKPKEEKKITNLIWNLQMLDLPY